MNIIWYPPHYFSKFPFKNNMFLQKQSPHYYNVFIQSWCRIWVLSCVFLEEVSHSIPVPGLIFLPVTEASNSMVRRSWMKYYLGMLGQAVVYFSAGGGDCIFVDCLDVIKGLQADCKPFVSLLLRCAKHFISFSYFLFSLYLGWWWDSSNKWILYFFVHSWRSD